MSCIYSNVSLFNVQVPLWRETAPWHGTTLEGLALDESPQTNASPRCPTLPLSTTIAVPLSVRLGALAVTCVPNNSVSVIVVPKDKYTVPTK